MTAELICVGTELLLGNIVNTNGAYIAQKCADLGLSMYYQSVVGDNMRRLCKCFRAAMKRSDVVILCGGLGPTQDDLTKEAVAKVLKRELVEDKKSRRHIEKFMKQYLRNTPEKTITQNNWKQALIPEGAIAVENDNGTAPGIIVEEGEKVAILLPGPPGELIPMFESKIYPYLHQRQPEIISSRTLKICGIGESQAETDIRDLIQRQKNPTVATYAKPGEVHIRLTARAADEEAAQKLIEPVARELRNRFQDKVYTEEEGKTLEAVVVELLKSRGLTVTTVESCTGGALSARIVDVPGASDVLKQGFVTYSNKAKRKLVKVKKSTLKEQGAVSRKCAKEMAEGGAGAAGADGALSVTGFAGPEGGTDQYPVGTVFIGCTFKGKTRVKECHFNGDRSSVREQAVVNALVLLRQCILEDGPADIKKTSSSSE